MDRMERLSQHMDRQFDVFSEDQEDWGSLFADAQALAFDSEGRIMLTPELRDHALLQDTVTFVGRGPTFQLWNPTLFADHQEQARQRLRQKRTAGFGTLAAVSASSDAGA